MLLIPPLWAALLTKRCGVGDRKDALKEGGLTLEEMARWPRLSYR